MNPLTYLPLNIKSCRLIPQNRSPSNDSMERSSRHAGVDLHEARATPMEVAARTWHPSPDWSRRGSCRSPLPVPKKRLAGKSSGADGVEADRAEECRYRLLRLVPGIDANDRRPGQHGHIERYRARRGRGRPPSRRRRAPAIGDSGTSWSIAQTSGTPTLPSSVPGSAAPCPSPCSLRRGCHGSRRCHSLRSETG